jgi:hypothetical protein
MASVFGDDDELAKSAVKRAAKPTPTPSSARKPSRGATKAKAAPKLFRVNVDPSPEPGDEPSDTEEPTSPTIVLHAPPATPTRASTSAAKSSFSPMTSAQQHAKLAQVASEPRPPAHPPLEKNDDPNFIPPAVDITTPPIVPPADPLIPFPPRKPKAEKVGKAGGGPLSKKRGKKAELSAQPIEAGRERYPEPALHVADSDPATEALMHISETEFKVRDSGLTREVKTPLPSNSPHDRMILRVALGGPTREVKTPLPSNSPHDRMISRVDLVGSHGRWKGPCLQTTPDATS